MRRRISPNNPVRRVLFPSSEKDEAASDNNRNIIREQFTKEDEANMKKWHYDFKNDKPLEGNGQVRWFNNEKGQLIGEVNGSEIDSGVDEPNDGEEDVNINKNDSSVLVEDLKSQNENTPPSTPAKNDIPPVPKKRPSIEDLNHSRENPAKRAILQ